MEIKNITPQNRKKIFFGTLLLGGALVISALVRRANKYNFAGKKVLITGGSRGLGLNIARKLVKKGAEVAIVGRNHDALEKAKSELDKIGNIPVHIYACDLKDRGQVEALAGYFLNKLKRIDVLINNAGIMQVGPENCASIQDYEDAMNTHFWAPLLLIRSVLPGMRQRKEGRIINISSIGGKISVPHMLPYSASKFALTGLSEGLHAELRKDNIFVTTVCPGLMRTGSYRNVVVKGDVKNEYAIFSVIGNSPITSVNVKSAAKKILWASKYGCAEVVIGIEGKLATLMHGLSPSKTAFWMSQVNKILPTSLANESVAVKGYQTESRWSASALTLLGRLAAKENNQYN